MSSAAAAFCLALDVPDAASAARWVARTRDAIGTYKIGLELFCAEGPQVVSVVRQAGAARIFLDLKLHDIPHTVARAVRAVARLGVDELTVHTSGGRAMLEAAQAEAGGMRLLGVTVLTSMDASSLAEIGEAAEPAVLVEQRARVAVRAGLTGLVCSAHEAGGLRAALGPEVYLVTPGIRAGGAEADQKRVATVSAARRAGANLLVIGRPVLEAMDPSLTLDALHREYLEAAHGL